MLHEPFTQTGTNRYIGVDIGGTNTRIGVFESLDSPECMIVARFPTFQKYEEQLQHIIAEIQASNREHLTGLGVSVAARIAKDGHSIIFAPNLPDYIDKPFAQSCSTCA